MSAYDERPGWRCTGTSRPTTTLEFDNALAMFRGGRGHGPAAVALQYFDGRITRAELDELSDALAAGLLANGFAPGDRLAVYLQNVPQFVIAHGRRLEGGRRHGVDQPDEPDAGAVLPAEGLRRHGAGLPWRRCTTRSPGRSCPDTDVGLVLTTSELEFQTRNDERLFAGIERAPARGHDGLRRVHRPSTAGRRRRRSSSAPTTSRS